MMRLEIREQFDAGLAELGCAVTIARRRMQMCDSKTEARSDYWGGEGKRGTSSGLRLCLGSVWVKNDSSREHVELTAWACVVFVSLGARLGGRTCRMPSGCI